jgi:hypothetical protein
MNFAPAPDTYDRRNEASFRALAKAAIEACFSRGRDLEIGAGRLILKDNVSGARYAVSMVSGVLTATLLP